MTNLQTTTTSTAPVFHLPDLVAIQRSSFRWFLEEGLIEELNSFSPITDYTGKLELHFIGRNYKLKEPKYSVDESKRRDSSYAVQMYVPTRLINKETGEIKEQEVFIGDLPLMTERGTFIINGAERVIVNQIVRSPGVYYKSDVDKNGRRTYNASLIPNRGAWLKFETDRNGLVWVRIDKTRKLSAQVLLKALGLSDAEISDRIRHYDFFEKTIEKEGQFSEEDALMELYRKLRPGEPPTVSGGLSLLESRFFDPKRYDLGRVGRYKLNKKLRLNVPDSTRVLTSDDILAAVDYLINLEFDMGQIDDIDHLGNRRVRSVGELLQNQVRVGLNRLERIIKERMTVSDADTLTPASLVNPKPLVAAIKEFFGSSQLSQFMDQTNPLAELTHKRRISALGPGGLTRERAGFAVRDIHPSHYGRICPIETPEGPNAGLIGSLATHARVSNYGFIETPYYRVENGRVMRENAPIYMTADEEDDLRVAPGDIPINPEGYIQGDQVPVRYRQDFTTTTPDQVDFVAVSPVQIISVATSLIPFIEHDDANRALMGSNMQRQAVPLLRPERPLVGTGLEAQAARDSGMVIVSRTPGVVTYVDSERICVQTILKGQKLQSNAAKVDEVVERTANLLGKQLSRLVMTKLKVAILQGTGGAAALAGMNEDDLAEIVQNFESELITPIHNQILPFVPNADIREWIEELRNLLIHWIENILMAKVFAAVAKTAPKFNDGKSVTEKIQEFEKTLAGHFTETIFRPAVGLLASTLSKSLSTEELDDVVNLVEKILNVIEGQEKIRAGLEFLTDLGALVARRGSSLIGKLREATPELPEIEYELQKYQRSNQDTCLNQRPIVFEGDEVEAGQVLADGSATEGGELALGQNILVAYMPWEGYNYEDSILISERLVIDDVYTSIHIEKYEIEARQTKLGPEEITREIPNVGEDSLRHLDESGIIRIGAWVESGEILVGKVTPKGESDQPPEEKLLRAIFGEKARDVRDNSLRVPNGEKGRVVDVRVFTREQGDELPPGANMVVRVYVALKRKIQVGDKMAGRHGNKGIISRILPQEDMPYLPDGTPLDIVLSPLGVPSRMNVGQIFECMLAWAGDNLNARFKMVPFDEMHGTDQSRQTVNRKLQQAREKTGKDWVYNPQNAGKIQVYDGRSGEPFDQPVTVGKAYMLKLVHLVDDKIHARSTGPYSLVTQQPLGGKAQQGGQRFGEMEVWALEAFGAAYTLQELLTVKSDDMQGRNEALNAIVKGKAIPRPGTPESFKVLMRELQSLCLDIAVHKVGTAEDGNSVDAEVDLMSDVSSRRAPNRPTYESMSKGSDDED